MESGPDRSADGAQPVQQGWLRRRRSPGIPRREQPGRRLHRAVRADGHPGGADRPAAPDGPESAVRAQAGEALLAARRQRRHHRPVPHLARRKRARLPQHRTSVPVRATPMSLIESTLQPENAVFRHVIPAGEPYLFKVKAGQTLRLLDLEGNQAVDTLFFSARNPRERYDPQRTLRRQQRLYLSTGTVLYSNLGNPLLTIVADTCGRHDTLGGACAQESNTVRYALDRRYMHSCRDNFLRGALHDGRLDKRDIG